MIFFHLPIRALTTKIMLMSKKSSLSNRLLIFSHQEVKAAICKQYQPNIDIGKGYWRKGNRKNRCKCTILIRKRWISISKMYIKVSKKNITNTNMTAERITYTKTTLHKCQMKMSRKIKMLIMKTWLTSPSSLIKQWHISQFRTWFNQIQFSRIINPCLLTSWMQLLFIRLMMSSTSI